jgi:lambda repressor-like predicted transcriptional regulator
MHTVDTKSRFLELRAKGWSLARIAAQIEVSQRTLVDWNRQHYHELRALRAVELEAVQEKILATHEHELTCLAQQLKQVEAELSKRKLDYESTRDLFRLAATLRSEIRKARLEPDFAPEPALAAPQPANP